MEPNEEEGYKWEAGYAEGLNIRSVLQENEQGSIEDSVRRIVLDAKRQRRLAEKPSKIRLGNMRYLYICVDCSMAMLNQSLQSNRMGATLNCLEKFLEKFFEQNPLSQLGVIACRDKRAERVIGFCSSPHSILEALVPLKQSVAYCNGEFSLNAGLLLALQSFQALPGHSSKEIIFLVGSLASIDGTSVVRTSESLKMRGVKCSVIGMGAEVYVYKRLCATTGGKYSVVLDENHFEMLLFDNVQPPIATREQESSIVKMGFPQRRIVQHPSFCLTHMLDETRPYDSREKDCDQQKAFYCSRCSARYCQTPIECKVCGLLLLTAPQLARAHHHLLPLPAFAEMTPKEGTSCFACSRLLAHESKSYACKRCQVEYCIDCDLLLHESLQICPSCE